MGGESERRYHVEGQTSTQGPRWQLWDNTLHYARFKDIADAAQAQNLCDELNRLNTRQPAARKYYRENVHLFKPIYEGDQIIIDV